MNCASGFAFFSSNFWNCNLLNQRNDTWYPCECSETRCVNSRATAKSVAPDNHICIFLRFFFFFRSFQIFPRNSWTREKEISGWFSKLKYEKTVRNRHFILAGRPCVQVSAALNEQKVIDWAGVWGQGLTFELLEIISVRIGISLLKW